MGKSLIRTAAAVFLMLSALPCRSVELREWSQFGVADVDAGRASSGYVMRSYFFAALGPTQAPMPQTNRFNECLLEALKRGAGAGTASIYADLDSPDLAPWSQIPEDLQRAGVALTAETWRQAVARRNTLIQDAMSRAKARFVASLQTPRCKDVHDAASEKGGVHLALVERVCRPGHDACRRPPFLDAGSANRSSLRFGKLFRWVSSQGVRHANEYSTIVPGGSLGSVVNATRSVVKAWPTQTADEAQREFEALVTHVRSRKILIDDAVPKLLDLPKEMIYRVGDVVRAPAIASLDLKAAADPSRVLLTISDEMARSRIRNCVHYLAARTTKKVEECSGYAITGPSLASCLSGGACEPPLSKTIGAQGFALSGVGDVGSLAKSSFLPRIYGSLANRQDYQRLTDECKKEGRATSTDLQLCVMRKSLPERDRKTLDCVTKGMGKQASATQCLVDSLPGNASAVASCVAKYPNDAKGQAWCALGPTLPPSAKAARDCWDGYAKHKSKEQLAVCLASPGMTSDQQRMVACLQKYPKDPTASAICYESGDNSLPKEAQDSLICAQTSGKDWKQFAGCMAVKNVKIGGDVGKIVECAAANGGEWVTTAACATGYEMTPEQQILVQCASTSPDPATFAICTGGQLSMREFVKCQGHAVGDEQCFGPNNEIRKFIRNLGLGDISENTVVAQILNLQVDLIKANVALAEGLVKGGAQMVTDVFNGVGQLVTGIGGAAASIVNGVGGAIQGLGNALGNALGFRL